VTANCICFQARALRSERLGLIHWSQLPKPYRQFIPDWKGLRGRKGSTLGGCQEATVHCDILYWSCSCVACRTNIFLRSNSRYLQEMDLCFKRLPVSHVLKAGLGYLQSWFSIVQYQWISKIKHVVPGRSACVSLMTLYGSFSSRESW